LPETHVFGDETIDGWLSRSASVSYQMAHGLLRAVAQIVFGEQTTESVQQARGWLRRRSSHSCGLLFEELSWYVRPAALIDKSPSLVYDIHALERVRTYFPEARFLHLVRHPAGYGESVLKYLKVLSRPAYVPRERGDILGRAPEWLRTLASFPYVSPNRREAEEADTSVDPQASWYVLNRNIVSFLDGLPDVLWMRIRGEELFADPCSHLTAIVEWIGEDVDEAVLEEMMHPERSPYARFGPPGARLGNDILFLQDPRFRPRQGVELTLDGPVSWLRDGRGFLPEVRELATTFGYS
jgi:hypothetical protein